MYFCAALPRKRIDMKQDGVQGQLSLRLLIIVFILLVVGAALYLVGINTYRELTSQKQLTVEDAALKTSLSIGKA
jgi:sensor histidine kinase regulating citrate/malate metabolism